MKFAFICGEEGNYPIEKMCVWAKVSRSGYYEWRGRGPSTSQVRRRELATLVAWSFEDSDGTYGYRRIHAHLARRGHPTHPETIRVLMRELGLVACQPRPWRPTTTVAGDASTTPDLVKRDFTCDTPATRLVGDITYIRTWEGWLYLATVLDCHTKQVVGYAMADHLRTSLIMDALTLTSQRIAFRPGITIFHSDRGCQGEFKWSSQHLDQEVAGGVGRKIIKAGGGGSGDGRSSAVAGGSGAAACDAFPGPAGGFSGGGACVLAVDRQRGHQRERGRRGGRVDTGRDEVVSTRWRHATDQPGRADWPLPVLR